MKKYLNDLRTALAETNRFSPTEIDEIIADHEEMIREALASGVDEDGLEGKFGSPAKVAADLAGDARGGRREDPSTVSPDFTGVPPAGTIGLSFRLASEDVTVTAEVRGDIVVTHEGDIPIDRYEIGFVADEFVLRRIGKKEIGGWFNRGSMAFDVRIPVGMPLSSVVLQTASGDYAVVGARGQELRVNCASGDGSVADVAFDAIRVASVNGDLSLLRSVASTVAITQVSGDVAIGHLVCEGTLELTSTSGDVDIVDSVAEACVFRTVSGDIEGKEFYPGTIEVRSVSGDVDITNADRTRPVRIKSAVSLSGEVRIREQ